MEVKMGDFGRPRNGPDMRRWQRLSTRYKTGPTVIIGGNSQDRHGMHCWQENKGSAECRHDRNKLGR